MNKKQYEAFRIECAKREGLHSVAKNKRGVITYIKENSAYDEIPYYDDHDSLQRIIDGLDYNETELYVGHLMLDDCHKLIKATIEQKQAALCAVFGLGDE